MSSFLLKLFWLRNWLIFHSLATIFFLFVQNTNTHIQRNVPYFLLWMHFRSPDIFGLLHLFFCFPCFSLNHFVFVFGSLLNQITTLTYQSSAYKTTGVYLHILELSSSDWKVCQVDVTSNLCTCFHVGSALNQTYWPF